MQLKENQAIARGTNLPISTKHSIELCSFVRGKTVAKAQTALERIMSYTDALPLKKHKKDIGHKKGRIAAGRYPQKATEKVLEIINSAEKNAQHKGLNIKGLVIRAAIANKASRPMRGGRQGRVQMKRTHVEIVVEEVVKATPKKEPAKKAEAKPQEKKETQAKPEEKKETKQ